MTPKQKKINDQLIADLNSKDAATALESVRKIKSLATAEIIPDLIKKWVNTSGEMEIQLTELLYTLKDPEAADKLIEVLDDESLSGHREKILAIFWNAGLNPTQHLSTFVGIAIEGNFIECLECLTIIENMDPPFPEEEMMDSLLQLKAYFGNNSSAQEDKYPLMRSIATIIKVTEETDEDDELFIPGNS